MYYARKQASNPVMPACRKSGVLFFSCKMRLRVVMVGAMLATAACIICKVCIICIILHTRYVLCVFYAMYYMCDMCDVYDVIICT